MFNHGAKEIYHDHNFGIIKCIKIMKIKQNLNIQKLKFGSYGLTDMEREKYMSILLTCLGFSLETSHFLTLNIVLIPFIT
jgi:hypothetical protein